MLTDVKAAEKVQISHADLLSWSLQLLEALEYLHFESNPPIVHRDVKPLYKNI